MSASIWDPGSDAAAQYSAIFPTLEAFQAAYPGLIDGYYLIATDSSHENKSTIYKVASRTYSFVRTIQAELTGMNLVAVPAESEVPQSTDIAATAQAQALLNNVAKLSRFAAEWASGTLLASSFGCSSDNEDDFENLQAALNEATGKRLIIDGDYKCSGQLEVSPGANVIEFTNGSLELTGDVDYLIHGTGGTLVLINPVLVDSTEKDTRTALHRAIRGSALKLLAVLGVARTDGFYTACHYAASGETEGTLVIDTIHVKNALGRAPQEGYGVNSSAHVNRIGAILYDNSEVGVEHGRHALYLNGGASYADVGLVDVNVCSGPPIRVALDETNVGHLSFGHINLRDVYHEVETAAAGCINISNANSAKVPGVSVSLGNVVINGYDGIAVSVPYGFDNLSLESLSAIGVRKQAEGNGSVVEIYNSTRCTIRDVYADDVMSDSSSVVRFRSGCDEIFCDNVRTDAETCDSVVRIADAVDHYVGILFSSGTTTNGLFNTAVSVLPGSKRSVYNGAWREEPVRVSGSTPSVAGLRFVTFTGGETVTDFLDGYAGQLLQVASESGTTTLTHNSAAIDTRNGTDIALGTRKVATFIRLGSRWLEVSDLSGVLTGSKTFDPSSIAAGAVETTTVTVTGAVLGDFASASFSLSMGGLILVAAVTLANTVTCTFFNPTMAPIDLGSGILRVRVTK